MTLKLRNGFSEETLKVKNMKLTFRECALGDAAFYRRVAYVVLPMIIQNTLSNVVSLLDNVMVGQIGTLPMSAVAIINQLLFIYYLCLWGAAAGAGIYTAQFFGKKDYEGVKYSTRIKLIFGILITCFTIVLLFIYGDTFTGLYIAKDTAPEDAMTTLTCARDYLRIMLIGLIPFAVSQAYAGTLRESGQTILPMKASMAAMVINFIFNGLLIFGLFGFPKLGVRGAAIATVISRFAEALIIIVTVHTHTEEKPLSRDEKLFLKKRTESYPFFKNLYRPFYIPLQLVGPILLKTTPLIMSEFLWSLGQATLIRCYSVRGISVIAAMNISVTISQIFNEIFLSLGNATSIIIGQELGAGKLLHARRDAWRMMVLSVLSCFVMGSLLYLCSPLIPHIYNTEDSIRLLATSFIRVISVTMFCNAIANVSYFTLRSGGKTIITFFFDAGFTWFVSVPAAYLLSSHSPLDIVIVFFIVSALEFLKGLIGIGLVKYGSWIKNIVADT